MVILIYQYAFPGNNVLHFIIKHKLSSKFTHMQNRLGHVLALAPQNGFSRPLDTLLWL